jgi:glycosyltransferase involved in cell wall biosynthesis
MNQVLLTVSGVIDPEAEAQIAAGSRPRTDYREMARAFSADLIDYAEARRSSGWLGKLIERVGGPNMLLAWQCFKQRHMYKAILTDGEQVGIPLALLLKVTRSTRVRHLMIVHVLSIKKKMFFFDLFRIQSHIDTFFVYSTWQKRFIEQRWHVAQERVVFTPFMVDAEFFSLKHVTPRRRRMICSVGLEFRDYPTLIEAVRGLDVEVIIAAASPWSKREDNTANQELPPNVFVRRYSQFELRQLYADSQFVVMPLYNVDFQAGVTAILEAMAMERAVICSRTTGQTDVVVEEETGVYVAPGKPPALRAAIQRLLDAPQEAERMGKAGRAKIDLKMSLDCYVERLSTCVQSVLQTGNTSDTETTMLYRSDN